MRKLPVIFTVVFALTSSAELVAQSRPHSPPPSRPSSPPSRPSTPPSRPSTPPSRPSTPPSRPSTPPSRPSTPPSRPSTPPSRPSTPPSRPTTPDQPPHHGPTTPPSRPTTPDQPPHHGPTTPPSRPTTPDQPPHHGPSTPDHGPTHNPPPPGAPTGSYHRPENAPGPHYNPPHPGPVRAPSHYEGRVIIHGPDHVPYPVHYTEVRYHEPRDYYTHVEHRYIFRRWIQEPVIFSYHNGYWEINRYPYYVHYGYRYRYSPVEYCQYQLVDSNTYSVVTDYGLQVCSVSYDLCAADRDLMNNSANAQRYFCAEGVYTDLQTTSDAEYSPSPIPIDQTQMSTIDSYLAGKDYIDLLRAGKNGIGKCSIQEPNEDPNSCRYVIKVGDQSYPQTDGSVCSQEDAASKMGCNVGSQKENAGCIIKAAIQEGYCL
jgi:hypothetical protein